MNVHKVIGIDLGTTYSAAAVWDGNGAQVIENSFGTKTTPSVVGVDPAGQVVVGEPALSRLARDPLNTVVEVKREMGVYERAPTGPDDLGIARYVRFRGRDHLPQEISAFILMELKRQAEAYIGEPVHDAVITVPAYFREPQRRATQEAAAMARLNVCYLLNEPTAAAVCFGMDKVESGRPRMLAVYDLGGGTFDVTIVQISEREVDVVGTGGDSRLGGGDFDDRITEHVLRHLLENHQVDLSGSADVRHRIKREAEKRKRELSTASAAVLDLAYLTPNLMAEVPITRAEFEALIDDLLARSLGCLDQAISSAYESNGVEADEIEQVLLVGGSTRIARIRPMLAEHLGLDLGDIRGDISPDEVVALGAALVARRYEPSAGYAGPDVRVAPGAAPLSADATDVPVLQDVTSHSLGILCEDSAMVTILPRDSRVPATITQNGFTNRGRTSLIRVLVFQGEHPVAFENHLIGELRIDLPEPRERGFYRFEVTFELDLNSLLTVVVLCKNDERRWTKTLECRVRANEDTIRLAADQVDGLLAQREGGAGTSRHGRP